MRFGDKQLGSPLILYKDSKGSISSLTPEVGSIAFATDTNELGMYTSTGWVWTSFGGGSVSGDMLKSVYDTDNDGIVDYANIANYVDWSGVLDPPTSYYPDSHADSHKSGGYDVINLDELGAPSDNTNLNATTSAHGLLPKLSGNSSQYLNGLGQWATPSASVNYVTNPILYTDCLYANTAALAPFYGVSISSGALGNPSALAINTSTVGVVLLRSSTTANGGYYIASSPGMFLPVVGLTVRGRFYFNNFSTTTFRFGIHTTTTSAAPTNGIYFEYSTNENISGKVTVSGSTTSTSSSYTASLNTWYTLTFTVTASNQVTFYVLNASGTQLWSGTVTATLPSNRVAFCLIATESSTMATDMLHVDYLGLSYANGVTR